MKRRAELRRLVFGFCMFFLTCAVTVVVAVCVYKSVAHLDRGLIVLILFCVIVVLAGFGLLIDALRRKYTVNKPVEQILEASERIARGDFSVRLEIVHTRKQYGEFDRIMENFNAMAAELEHNEVLKNDFISNVSHEIKTPLAVIQSYAARLADETLTSEERQKCVQTMTEAQARLTGLVTNILKLNKLENGQLMHEYAAFRLDEQLTQCILSMEEIIDEKRLHLDCEIDEATLLSCPQYLEIVWNNLLSNAVKFTPEGGSIAVSLKAQGDRAVVRVSDTGCGISAETGKHIFDKFYQGDTSHAGEGNGLGLALVKKVIDVLGGEISVESELGVGSTFTVALKGLKRERQG